MTPHNYGKICAYCTNRHTVFGDDACNVTGTRITPTKWRIIYLVGCASFNNGHEKHQDCDNATLDKLIHEYDTGDHPEISDCDTTDEWYGHGWDDCRAKFVERLKSLRRGES